MKCSVPSDTQSSPLSGTFVDIGNTELPKVSVGSFGVRRT